jgi:hypothetical protein
MENRIWAYIDQFSIFIFGKLRKKLLYAYMENTLNSEIRSKIVYISVNNNKNFKFLDSFYLYYIGLI